MRMARARQVRDERSALTCGVRGIRILFHMLKRRAFLTFSPTRPAPPPGYWQHVSRAAMACRFEVTLPLEDQAGVSEARQALDEVDRLEDQLTIFRTSSEVSFINREAAAGPVCVEQSLFSLLLRCRELCRETGGASASLQDA